MRAENSVSPLMTSRGHGLRVPSSGRSKSEMVQAWSFLLLKSMRMSSVQHTYRHSNDTTLYGKKGSKVDINVSDAK
jgi:hypothetical protein